MFPAYKKKKFMLFIPSKTKDFHPRFKIDNQELELVEETKFLGLIIRRDLFWTLLIRLKTF